jgi:hypothetical protein
MNFRMTKQQPFRDERRRALVTLKFLHFIAPRMCNQMLAQLPRLFEFLGALIAAELLFAAIFTVRIFITFVRFIIVIVRS